MYYTNGDRGVFSYTVGGHVSSHSGITFISDVRFMAIETVHNTVLSLAHILDVTYVTCQNINEVIALTGDIGGYSVCAIKRCTRNSASHN